MCGFVVFAAAPAAPEPTDDEMRSLVRLLAHRGPDDLQTTCGGGICFGFARLAIIDSAGSAQPLAYPPCGPQAGRWTLVCNGEIYNYRELREELRREHGAIFGTEGDAEVLAAVLHHWGPEGLHRLRGMFAYVAWDAKEKTLHAGRDPFGIKPLYYQIAAGGLWLASERKALPGNGHSALDGEALSHYLTMQYVPEPYTLDPSVRRLAAGSRLVWRPGSQVDITRYSKPAFRPRPELGLEQAAVRIREALRESVRAHLTSDVPVGAFLSSGIDSTAVVALAAEHNPDLTVFSAGFDIAGYSEIEHAEQAARHLGVRLIPTVVTELDVIRELPRIVWHLDDPVADPALVPLFFLARTASEYVKVVLSGEGADELFAGYRIYREPAAVAPVRRLPDILQSGLRRLSAVMPEGVRGKSYLNRATTPIESRYYGNARMFDDEQKARLIGHLGPVASHRSVTAAAYAEAAGLDEATIMQYVDLQTWLPGDILTKADRMTMAHSLELRVPFLDRQVFDVAAELAPELKLPPGSKATKFVLRHALRPVVPAFVVNRPKLGFPTPTARWLRGELGEWTQEILASSGAHDMLDLGYAQQLLQAHRRGELDHGRKVWTILVFCLWHAVFVEKRFAEALAAG